MDQVARNEGLLNTARDYFYFVTEFFEPINASATHIYHSALELSPLSSIVRRLYYHQQQIPLPRVLVGTWDSWDQGTAISGTCGRGGYCSYTWSPCGQFVAVHAEGVWTEQVHDHEIVEIRDGVTLQLLSTLTPPDAQLFGGPSYSPDGSSLASLTDTSLIIWDIQTGGVAKKMQHNSTEDILDVSLVWSLDGGTIGTIFRYWGSETWNMHTCDVISGTILSSITFQSGDNPHLWAHNTSFHVMTTGWDGQTPTINIFEVGSTLIKIESFQINLWATGWTRSSQEEPLYEINSFSPTTYHISICDGDSFAILDVWSSECLLEQKGLLGSDCFSFEGSLYAACWDHGNGIHIWKYTSGHYTLWGELPLQKSSSDNSQPLYFSPLLSSILSSLNPESLWVWQLDVSPSTVTTSPFWPCFWPSSLFFPTSRFTRYSSHSARKTTKTSNNQIVLQNTTVAKHYLLNGRRRPRDPPNTRVPHHATDRPPRPGRTPETESTAQSKTLEGSEERTPR
jgi:hypothetical protein